jgi:DNA-binding LytR/AlgR family response regulator
MKVVIVENEQLAAEKLIGLIKNIQPEVEIIQILETVEEAVNWFTQNVSPDLVFMDIQLDDGNSFEIFDAVKITAPVIFTTAYDEYAIRAFKVNSIDYLLKPIEKEALDQALQKYKSHFAVNDLETKVAGIVNQINTKYKTRFFIKIGVRFKSIPIENICCFFVQERNTFLKTDEGKSFDLDDSLDQLQKRVDPNLFFRINRNFLVNINYIDEIISYSANRLKLKINHEEDLIVSRDKVSDFKHWMDR